MLRKSKLLCEAFLFVVMFVPIAEASSYRDCGATAPTSPCSAIEKEAATELFLSVLRADEARVARLLSSGASLQVTDEFGWTPLMLAAKVGRVKVVEILLRNGADPNESSPDGFSALTIAVSAKRGGVASKLIEYGANPNVKSNVLSPLAVAALENNAKLIGVLLKSGADIREKLPNGEFIFGELDPSNSGAAKGDLINAAIISGNVAQLRQLIPTQDRSRIINDLEIFGFSALAVAAMKNDEEMVRYLMGAGADPNKFMGNLPPILASIYTVRSAPSRSKNRAIFAMLAKGSNEETIKHHTKLAKYSALELSRLMMSKYFVATDFYINALRPCNHAVVVEASGQYYWSHSKCSLEEARSDTLRDCARDHDHSLCQQSIKHEFRGKCYALWRNGNGEPFGDWLGITLKEARYGARTICMSFPAMECREQSAVEFCSGG